LGIVRIYLLAACVTETLGRADTSSLWRNCYAIVLALKLNPRF
jgi:hypothetical protein